MSLVAPTVWEEGQDRQNLEFDRRMTALEAAIASLSAQVGSGGQIPSVTTFVSSQGILARQSGGNDIGGSVIEFDTSAGFAVTGASGYPFVSRTASGTVPSAVAAAGSAGSSIEAANRDHTHAGVTSLTLPAALITLSASQGAITGAITTPVQTYAVSNVTTDRAYDADSTTLDELSDIVGTLIADLRAKGLVA